eukprot:187606_1
MRNFLLSKVKILTMDSVERMNDNTFNESRKSNDKETFIIGSSVGRTGTSSLQRALNILGYNCYHMRELTKNSDFELWIPLGTEKLKLKQNELSDTELVDYNEWNTIFTDRNYTACVDEPSCCFYKELMRHYPNYKVIHSVRDSEKWYNSARQTTMAGYLLVKNKWFLRWVAGHYLEMLTQCLYKFVYDIDCDDQFDDKELAKKKYDEWNEEVVNYVPKDRLLLFDVKQGWEPLCAFLGIKDIPQQPFPHSNERMMITNAIRMGTLICNIVDLSVLIASCGVAYYMYQKKTLHQISICPFVRRCDLHVCVCAYKY